MRHEDVYIGLLRQAMEDLKAKKGISYIHFGERLRKLGLEQEINHLYPQIYHPFNPATSGTPDSDYMSLSAYMMLLQYQEFHHALNESKTARKEARLAMYFAAGAIVVQVGIWLLDSFVLLKK